MSEVKWIKITTDMFDNRKIKHLRKLPEGNNIVLIWVMLLTMAGRCNANGMIFLTENIPYTAKLIADELDFEENTVALAIEALTRLGMLCVIDETLVITNWAEYQNVDSMERLRDQTRQRVAKYRENQKKLAARQTDCEDVTLRNVTGNATVTQSNAVDIEEDIDSDKDTTGRMEKSARMREYDALYHQRFLAKLKEMRTREDELSSVISFYEKGAGQLPTAYLVEDLKHFTETLGAEITIHAIESAFLENKTTAKYILAILKRYEREGLDTMEKVIASEKRFEAEKEAKRKNGGRSAGNDPNIGNAGKDWHLPNVTVFDGS